MALFLTLFALCNCLFSSSYRLSDSTREEKPKSCGGNACTLNVFIVECSSVPYIMVSKYIHTHIYIYKSKIPFGMSTFSGL